jgi:hypothetical protein
LHYEKRITFPAPWHAHTSPPERVNANARCHRLGSTWLEHAHQVLGGLGCHPSCGAFLLGCRLTLLVGRFLFLLYICVGKNGVPFLFYVYVFLSWVSWRCAIAGLGWAHARTGTAVLDEAWDPQPPQGVTSPPSEVGVTTQAGFSCTRRDTAGLGWAHTRTGNHKTDLAGGRTVRGVGPPTPPRRDQPAR